MYERCLIKKYIDFDLKNAEEGCDIPAGQTRTFLFSLIPNKNYFPEDEDHFLYLLPFIHFKQNDVAYTMPAQTQATVIQPPFTPEYVLALMEGDTGNS